MSETVISKIGDSNFPLWEQGVRQQGQMNVRVMTDNFLDFKEAMDRHGVRFVFIFGTLLGAIRDKKLMEYDTDADVMCYADDHRKIGKVIEELKGKGFFIPDKNECPFGDHFFIRDGEKIEIWWFSKIGKEYIYDNQIRYPQAYFDETEIITFLGHQFTVPKSSAAFLELTYGPTWVTPDPNGSYVLGR